MKVLLFFFVTLIILMFPGLCFSIGSQFVNLYVPFVLLALSILFIIQNKKLKRHILFLYKKTPFKYFCWFALWGGFTIVMSVFTGKFRFGGFITSTLGGLICSVLCPFIFVSFVFSKILSTKFLIRFLYGFCWFVFVFALFDFIIYLFDISFLKDFVSILCNKRSIFANLELAYRASANNYIRAKSIFEEPSYLGYFILLLSPIIYEIHYAIKNIFKNSFVNLVIKKTMIPFMWISLILTQSPIFLIFNLLFTVFYYIKYRNLKTIMYKYRIFILSLVIPIIFILLYSFMTIDFQQTYLNRIILVVQNINSFDKFVMVEPSLATRVIIFICGCNLFLQTYLFGVGYGNLSYLMQDLIINSNLPLTPELSELFYTDNTHLASMIFIKMISETGFIGFVLFYYFLFKTILTIQKYENMYEPNMKFLFRGFKMYVILFVLTSIYDSNINQAWCWVIFGMIYANIINHKLSKIQREEDAYKIKKTN